MYVHNLNPFFNVYLILTSHSQRQTARCMRFAPPIVITASYGSVG